MSDFVTLTCPSCGGTLQVTNDIDRFACAHCGAEHVVRRGGGLVSLAPVVAEIKHVSAGVDRTASELAIKRLTGEIAELEKQKLEAKAKGCSFGAVGVGAVIACGGLAISAALWNQIGDTAGMVVMFLGLLIGGVVFWLMSSQAEQQAKSEAAEVEEKIQGKRKQLAGHEELVSKE